MVFIDHDFTLSIFYSKMLKVDFKKTFKLNFKHFKFGFFIPSHCVPSERKKYGADIII